MQEQQRSHERPGTGGPGLAGGIFDTAGLATVSHGPYAEQLPVAGMTVGQVRDRFRDRLDIDPESRPFLDSQPVDDDTVVGADQMLMFLRRAGEKGHGNRRHRG